MMQVLPELSSREREVVRLVNRGLSNRAIAKELGLVVGTVKIHLHHVFTKLRVASRVELVVRFRQRQQRAKRKKAVVTTTIMPVVDAEFKEINNEPVGLPDRLA